jgi:hypothetical protein
MAVTELRVALTVEAFDEITTFYRDGLGLDPGDIWTDHGRGQVFNVQRATLEVLDAEHSLTSMTWRQASR